MYAQTWVTATKYYHAVIQEDLFGALTLVKTWGGRGNRRGGRSIDPIESYYAGQQAIEEIGKKRKRKKYVPLK
jgi:predicted DNA-binding WGR domain protein